jgi:vancomycin permeability regulator SanA
MKRFGKWLVIVTVIALFVTILGINLYIVGSTKARIFNQVSNLPQREFGLVMGTDMLRFNGSTNLHFLNRTEGAAQIYTSGKASHLLISGNKERSELLRRTTAYKKSPWMFPFKICYKAMENILGKFSLADNLAIVGRK